MRRDSLLAPGEFSNAIRLQVEACSAISQVETQAGYVAGGKIAKAKKLADFFTDCASKLAAFIDSTATSVVSRVRTATNTVVITFNETMDTSTSVPLSTVVFSPARTVTAIAVSGTTMTITATGAIATDTVTYTPPTGADTDKGLKDRAGNLAGTFTGVVA